MPRPRLYIQTVIIGIGRFLNMAVAGGTLMVLARVLPDKESYGAVNQLLMLYLVFSQIFAVGLPQSIYFFLPRYRHGERRGFLVQTIVLLMGSGLLLGLGLFFGAELLGHVLGNPELPDLLRIFAVYPLFMLPTMAVEGTLLHAGRPLLVVLFTMAMRLGMFCALVLPTLIWHAPLAQTIRIWMGVGSVMWAIALALMLSTVRGLPLAWRREMLKDEWHFSLPLTGVTLLVLGFNYLDRFLVSHYFGAATFGIYANAAIDVPTVSMVANALSAVLTAEFSRRTSEGDAESLLPLWHHAVTRLAVLIFASLGFLAFWPHETMRLLFSSAYAASGGLFAVLVWLIPLRLVAMQPLYVALGATRQLALLMAADLVLGVICMVLGAQLFGLYGIAAGSLCAAYLGTAFGCYVFAYRLTHIGWRRFLPWRQIGIALGLALAAGALSRVITLARWPELITYLAALLLFLAAYALGLYSQRMHRLLIPARRVRETEAVIEANTE